MSGGTQRFGQDVRELFRGRHKTRAVDLTSNSITQLISMAKDVLSQLESHRVASKVERSLAVKIERRWRRDAKTGILQKITMPDAFAAGKRGRMILGLRGRGRDRFLATGPPRDKNAAQKDESARRGILDGPRGVRVYLKFT